MPSLAPQPKFRFFTAGSLGLPVRPLVGGKVYFYAAGTTTPKDTYTDSTGTVPNTNPVVLDARGEADIWLGTGTYKMVVRDALGVQQGGTVDNIRGMDDLEAALTSYTNGLVNTLTSNLSNKTDPLKGAGQVGFNYTLNYAVGSIGAELGQIVRPESFGAKGDSNGTVGNGTDDTAAINAALAWAATVGSVGRSAGSTVQLMPRKCYRVSGTLLITSFTTLDLNNSVLVGTGNSSTGNTLIKTAIYTGGVLVSNEANYGAGARLTGTRVRGGTLVGCGLGALLTGYGEGCVFEEIQFYQCYHALDADFSFYDGVRQLMARNTSTSWAYRLRNFANVQTLHHVSAVGYQTGLIVDTKAYALTILSCAFEQGVNGVQVANEAHGLSILECYFEMLTGKAIDLNDVYRKTGVNIDGNFFDSCATLVRGRSVNGFTWGASTERSATCSPGTIDIKTDTTVVDPRSSSSTGVLRSRDFELLSSLNSLPTLPSWWLVDSPTDIDANRALVTSTSGIQSPVFAKARLNSGVVPFDYGGTGGSLAGSVIFTNVSFSGGTTFNILIDTELLTDGYNFLVFRFDIADNSGTYKMIGRTAGGDVFFDSNTSAKTLAVSAIGGKVRLTLGSFSHPNGTASVTGVVRHV